MSDRQRGNRRENEFGEILRDYGYEPFYSRGSRGVDILAVKLEGTGPGPHLRIAVCRPTAGAIRGYFAEMAMGAQIAGSRDLVAKQMRGGSWRIYWSGDEFATSLAIVLAEFIVSD